MNRLFKEYLWPVILIFLAGLFDIFLRNFSIEKLKILTEFSVSINIIEIFIIGLFIFYLSRFFPAEYKKRKNKFRATRLQTNWIKFKALLEQYVTTRKDSQAEYQDLRKRIREDLNYFLTDITDALKKTGYGQQLIVLNNFQQCFEPIKLNEWPQRVTRDIPRELECFDYILAALVRSFDK